MFHSIPFRFLPGFSRSFATFITVASLDCVAFYGILMYWYVLTCIFMYCTSEASVASSLLCCCCCCGLVAFFCVRRGKSSIGDSSSEPFRDIIICFSGPVKYPEAVWRSCNDLVNENRTHLLCFTLFHIVLLHFNMPNAA